MILVSTKGYLENGVFDFFIIVFNIIVYIIFGIIFMIIFIIMVMSDRPRGDCL